MPNNDRISLYEALHRDFKAAQSERGITAPMISEALGHKSTSMWLYDLFKGKGLWSWEHVEPWVALTGGKNLMRWLGGECGFVVYPLADLPAGAALGGVVKEFGEYLTITADANPSADQFENEMREALEAMGAIWAHMETRRKKLNERKTPNGEDKF